MWTLAGRHKGLWNIPGFDTPIHGFLDIAPEGYASLELLLTKNELSVLFARQLEHSDTYPAVIGEIDAEWRRNPVTLIGAWHTATDRLYVECVVFGAEMSQRGTLEFSRISLLTSDLGAWPLTTQESPITVPWDIIHKRADYDIAVRIPPRIGGDDGAPSIGLAPDVNLRNATELRYDLHPTLSWQLDVPRDLDGCITLVHAAHTFLILLLDTTVEINGLTLQNESGVRVDVIYEPYPSGKRKELGIPLARLRQIAGRFTETWAAWTRMCLEIPAVIGSVTSFYFATNHGTDQLFVLATALESFHKWKRPSETVMGCDEFNVAKRLLLAVSGSSEMKKLVQERLRNEPSLRARLKDLTRRLQDLGVFTPDQGSRMVSDLVEARNGFGHSLTSGLSGHNHLKRVYQAHIVLKALLLEEIGILDVAVDVIRKQWNRWENR